MAAFDSLFGLPTARMRVVEMVHALAPDASLVILLVPSTSLDNTGSAVSAAVGSLRLGSAEGGVMSFSAAGQVGGEHCVSRAQADTVNAALQVAAGEFADAGHPLFTIIDTEHWYAIGNFRETELAGMVPGQHATIYVLAQPSRPVRGKVDSLGWGVASDVSATIGGLPHVERTLNWVRIAARFPVRILLDTPPDDLMRYGATAVIVIDK